MGCPTSADAVSDGPGDGKQWVHLPSTGKLEGISRTGQGRILEFKTISARWRNHPKKIQVEGWSN